MKLRDLQKAIDFARENYDNWADIPLQSEISMSGDQVLLTEIESCFIDEEGEFFVFRNE